MTSPDPAHTFKLAPEEDPLRAFRDEFVIPTNRQMKAGAVPPDLGECMSSGSQSCSDVHWVLTLALRLCSTWM